MDYSLYILYGDESAREADLIGDTGLLAHAGAAAMGALTDAIDLDIYDQYASKLKSKNSIALRGSMITDMKFNTEASSFTTYDKGTSSTTKFVQTKITVKGRLYMPLSIGSVNKKKNTAKILMWANTPFPTNEANDNAGKDKIKAWNVFADSEANKVPEDLYQNYYRKVIATIYATTDKQFRAVILAKAFVDSYEESYNSKDGDGTFTLVIKERLDSIGDVIIQGPTYNISAISAMSKVAEVAGSVSNKTSKVTQTVEKFTGETEATKKLKDITGTIDTSVNTSKSLIQGNVKVDDITDDIDKHTDDAKEKYTDDIIDENLEDSKDYLDTYNKLNDEQKNILKGVPGFDKMSTSDKLKYIDKLLSNTPEVPKVDSASLVKNKIEETEKYIKAYKNLNDDELNYLKGITDFNNMSITDKMKHINNLSTFMNDYKGLTDDQKSILNEIPGFNNMTTEDKLSYIKTLKENKSTDNKE